MLTFQVDDREGYEQPMAARQMFKETCYRSLNLKPDVCFHLQRLSSKEVFLLKDSTSGFTSALC